jgi:hypothetical protein
LLLPACGSPAANSSSGGETMTASKAGDLDLALRVTYRDTRHKLELVSSSHTDAANLYSKQRTSADTKVQTDRAVQALLKEFETRGFDKYAREGRAPSNNSVPSFEVETPDGVRTLLKSKAAPLEAQKSFNECLYVFQLLYNETHGLQVISNQSGGALFDEQKKKLGKQP